MNIVIPFENRVRMVFRAPDVTAKRKANGRYLLEGETLRLDDIEEGKVMILPDTISIEEGEKLTQDMESCAQPFEKFVMPDPVEAMPNAIGLLLRTAVADGRVSDAEQLTIKPALEGRTWQPGISVQVGDVFTHDGALWRCVQEHTTQSDWTPECVPALWKKVEVRSEEGPRVWQAGVDYVVKDRVAYPDSGAAMYECLQGHTSQVGWEPANVQALWKRIQD